MSLVSEFLAFLKHRKKLWLLPILIVILAVGGLIFVAEGTVFAPFIYTLF